MVIEGMNKRIQIRDGNLFFFLSVLGKNKQLCNTRPLLDEASL